MPTLQKTAPSLLLSPNSFIEKEMAVIAHFSESGQISIGFVRL